MATRTNQQGGFKLDIGSCRRASPYSSNEYFLRSLWALAYPLFRFSPRTCFKWRNLLLTLFGAKIGEGAHIYSTAFIYLPWMLDIGKDSSIGEWVIVYNIGLIKIGDRATISHGAQLCSGTHDYEDSKLPLVRSTLSVGAEAWVCTQAYVGPGVTIGEGSVVGARSVVVNSVEPWTVVAGNPAIYKKDRHIRI